MSAIDNPKQDEGIIVFDFDGTITTKDTFALFLKYYAGSAKWLFNIIQLLPIFIAYKINSIDRHAVKKAVIKKFFSNHSIDHIESRAAQFAINIIPNYVRAKAAEDLRNKLSHPNIGCDRLYICSASIGPYLRHWAHSFGIHPANVMATELEAKDGRATGNLEGYNVWGANKVRRIFDEFAPQSVKIEEAYGDTRGDREMLHAAQASFFRPFRA